MKQPDQTKPHILALDSSCGQIAACIIAHGKHYTAAPQHNDSGKTRSTAIIPLLNTLLSDAGISWQQLDVLALGAGPGSFTGIRIAAATLAGINAGLKLPILHLSSLAITARQAGTTETIHVLEDARAGELFTGLYRHGKSLEVEACISWNSLDTYTRNDSSKHYCCQSEPAKNMDGWIHTPLTLTRSRALALEAESCHTAVSDWSTVPRYPSPVYLQQSQAERQANG